MKRLVLLVILVVMTGLLFAGGQAENGKAASDGKTKILWWSHWANEPSKKVVIETIKDDYMAANPDVEIELVWWDKKPLQDAWRTANTAGTNIPDIVTDPEGDSLEQLKAGWFLDLGEDFPWDNYYSGVRENNAQFPGIEGDYKYGIGRGINMIFYNREIFKEIGVSVPDNYTFTADEMVDIVKKAKAAGYAGVANAIGNRPYPGLFPVYTALFNLTGRNETYDYLNGLKSWETSDARQVLEWTAKLRDAGFWPESYATMTIDDFHVYFHTLRNSAMLYIPSWYTGRGFKPEADGGQSPDFKFGMLRYPVMDGSRNANKIMGSFESGYMISSVTEYPEVSRDILAFATQPKYGALWEAYTKIPTCIKYEESDIPEIEDDGFGWYVAEINKVYTPLDVEYIKDLAPPERSGEFKDAITSALNEGLPLGLITVDEAVEMLDSAVK